MMSSSTRAVIPGGFFRGELRPPSDKSITHRAVLFSALAKGTSRIVHPLAADDCERTAEAFRSLGVSIEMDRRGEWVVMGRGLYGLNETASGTLYCGNSGTTLRTISGVLAGQTFATRLMGDKSLTTRPMGRVIEPLRAMGADITAREDRFAPLTIRGHRPLKATHWVSPVASAQVKTCVLLAGLYCEGRTTFEEPILSRDHSERMLSAAGVRLHREGLKISVEGGQSLNAQEWVVPGDISSAAFFVVAALIMPGSELLLREVGVNPTRDGSLEVLKAMGASISWQDLRSTAGEPITDLLVRASSLKGVAITEDMIPRLVDEVPILAVAATQAQGVTEITGAGELRVKESDRLKHVAEELSRMGAAITELPDGLRITGPTPLKGATVDSFEDHRLAMAFAVAGLIAQGETHILNADCVDISFPAFWEEFEKLRAKSSL